jgi:hypothetical protein
VQIAPDQCHLALVPLTAQLIQELDRRSARPLPPAA